MSRTATGDRSRVLPTVTDTETFGAELARELVAGDLVILDGPLGAGKTALSRGLGAGLRVSGRITSPTFVIARVHPASEDGGLGMVHVDAYRLGTTGVDVLADLDALDLDTALEDSVVVVEWGAGIAERLADRHMLVRLRRDPDGVDLDSEARTVTWGWRDSAELT